MKNKDIHFGLDNSETRDFLATNVKLYDGESVVATLKKRIAELEQRLKDAEKGMAAYRLLDVMGWEEFDVSDMIEDYSPEVYFSFVGTKEEFDEVFTQEGGV